MTRTQLSGWKIGRALALAAALTGTATLAGCSDAQAGSLLGAGLGALAGQAIGHDTEATLIGTAVGAGAGYVIGNESDKGKLRYGNPGYSQPYQQPYNPPYDPDCYDYDY